MISRATETIRRYGRPNATVEERNVWNLVVQTALAGVISGGIITFITVYVTRLGASAFEVSLLTSLPALLTIVVAIPAGTIVARRRDLVRDSALAFLVVRVCYLLVAFATLLTPVAAIWVIVAIWAFTAFPAVLANTAWYSVFADAIPANRRAAVNGGRWSILGLVTACSVAVFGWLLDRLPFPSGYQVMFVASFFAGVANVYYYARLIVPRAQTSPRARNQEPLGARLRNMVAPLVQPGPFFNYCVGSTILRLGMFLAAGLYSIYWVRDLHASDGTIGLRTTIANAALVVGYPLWGWATSRLGHERALVMAAAGLGFYPILTGLVPSAAWLLAPALIWGLFAGGIDVTLFEGMLRSAPAENRVHYVALNTALANLVMFLGPILGAAMAGIVPISIVLFVAGGLHLVASASVTLMARSARHGIGAGPTSAANR